MTQAIDPTEEAQRLVSLFAITDADLALLRSFGQEVDAEIEAIVDEFYTWLPALPEFKRFFPNEDTTLHLRSLQASYWRVFLRADVDVGYVQGRRKVGNVHATIGLPLQAYFAAMNRMFTLLTERANRQLGGDAGPTIHAMGKLMFLDMNLVAAAFSDLTSQTIAEQSEAIMAMSTPVAEVAQGVLMLPLVGVIDSMRAQDIMSAMLTRIRDTGAKVFILDISGVAVVDTAVANHLIRMTRASQLMGCESIISGLSPAVARTIVALDIDISRIDTRANLRDAIDSAFTKIGLRLSSAMPQSA
ncbi:MAG: protoglobin domain-containing protein [Myxococcales bacterium]|nr:protoglobin domain-containing protein [Myxococcales bacterium]